MKSRLGQYSGPDKEFFFKVPSKLQGLSLAVLTFIMSNCGQRVKSVTDGPDQVLKASALRDTDSDCLVDIIDPHVAEPDEFIAKDITKGIVARMVRGEISSEAGEQIAARMRECLKAKQPKTFDARPKEEVAVIKPQEKSLPAIAKQPVITQPPKQEPPKENPKPNQQPPQQPKPKQQPPQQPKPKQQPPQQPKPKEAEPKQESKPTSLEEGKTALLKIFPGASFDSDTNTFTVNGFSHSVKELKITVREDGQYVADIRYLDGTNDSFSSDSVNIKNYIKAGINSWNSDIADRHSKAKTAFEAKGFKLKSGSKISQTWENGSKTIDINFYKTKAEGSSEFRATIIASGQKTVVSDRVFNSLIKKIASAL